MSMKHTLSVPMPDETFNRINLLSAGFNMKPATLVNLLINSRYNSLIANNENFAAFVENQKSVQTSLFN